MTAEAKKMYIEDMIRMTKFVKFDEVKYNVRICLINTQANLSDLLSIPHMKIEDLSAICTINAFSNVRGRMLVTNELIAGWGIDKNTLFDIAFQNMALEKWMMYDLKDCVYTADNCLKNLLDDPKIRHNQDNKIFVLTNKERVLGAAVMLCKWVMEEIGEIFPNGFYIIPSSIHECIIIQKNEKIKPENLGEIVREVNRENVLPHEVLSGNVYSYDKKLKKIYAILK